MPKLELLFSNRVVTSLVTLLFGVLWTTQSLAAPVFFVAPGNNPTSDIAWQTAVGSFAEQDFETGFPASGGSVSSFNFGPTTVTPNLPGYGAGAEIFVSGAFNTNGTVYQKALLSCARPQFGVCDNEITFAFSQSVIGFGLWIFDNSSSSVDSFEMVVNGHTSNILDANPGSGAHIIEGFLGVVDTNGINSLTIRNASGTGAFEMDHLQIATSPAPEPGTLAILGLGLAGIGFRRTKRLSQIQKFHSAT